MVWKLDDINKVMMCNLGFSILIGLLYPPSFELGDLLGINHENIPIFSWIANVPGVQQHLGDYMLFLLCLTPVWLAIFGWVYTKYYSSDHINVPLLLVVATVVLMILIFLMAMDLSPEAHSGAWREDLLIDAARSRVLGSFVLGGMTFFLYVMLSIAVVKMPIDVWRRMRAS
jgi:hypothetical protein